MAFQYRRSAHVCSRSRLLLKWQNGLLMQKLCMFLQGKKRRKQVDRRASKGRKLRFHVQDKLVSFMSPVEAAADAMAPKLFRNLFGIKA